MNGLRILSLVIALVVGAPAGAQDVPLTKETLRKAFEAPSYSPYAERAFPTRLLWGDTHVHTHLSLDARAAGVTLSQEDAYRFARGDEISASGGMRIRIGQPLDFLVVTDHSDAMGVLNGIVVGNPDLIRDRRVRNWHQRLQEGGSAGFDAALEVIESVSRKTGPRVLQSTRFADTVWTRVAETADAHNVPGRFSAIIGYEWSSTRDGNNLHRNVIYRDGSRVARQVLPFTVGDSRNPEDLWRWMARYESTTGGRVLATAHNGNLSNGLMFPDRNPATNRRLTSRYARNRARWEPIYEVTQIKGDSEAHPFLSPDDEFAGYDKWDTGNLRLHPKKDSMLEFEYAREALKNGLRHEERLGINPFKIGFQAGTDSHTSLATAEEDNFFGKHAPAEPKPRRGSMIVGRFKENIWPGWSQVASGYTAVWARENTREAIFDAMMRKESYATTGSRIQVRFFGAWDFVAEDANTRLPANVGYYKGVPMGGDLTAAPDGKSPTFLVAARKDPLSGNLDRIQIVKGWLDSEGATHEKVYDVVWAGDRKFGADGKLPPVGDTVDVENAIWTNTIGLPELISVWIDPDFDPTQRAFYYARVIEIPTPRWTAYDAKYFGVDAPAEAPMTTQERAYTSPIWFTP